MGTEVESQQLSPAVARRQRERVRHAANLLGGAVSTVPTPRPTSPITVGAELELNLVRDDGSPALCNERVLEALGGHAFQDELARFNLEINLDPLPVTSSVLSLMEQQVVDLTAQVRDAAATQGALVTAVGLLPTLEVSQLPEQWMSNKRRYSALAAALGLDGESAGVCLSIGGPFGERYEAEHTSLAPEAACTSFQLHYAAPTTTATDVINAAHVAMGPLVSMAANSPFFGGRALWHESRIPVFTQILDTRTTEHIVQDVVPRVHAGTGWAQDLSAQLEASPLLHSPLLPAGIQHDDPHQRDLEAFAMHHGTVYTWVRPLVELHHGTPHFRIENRVLSAGPTPVDMVANAAFFFGMVAALTPRMSEITKRLSFDLATRAMWEGAYHGPYATLPDLQGRARDAVEAVCEEYLPVAATGLESLGVDQDQIAHYLGIIRARAQRRGTGSCWQLQTVQSWQDHGLDRHKALREMLLSYIELSSSNIPVHEW